MPEIKRDRVKLSRYCKTCREWLDSHEFFTSESLMCKKCQLKRINY